MLRVRRYFVNPLNSKVQVTSLKQKLVRKEDEEDDEGQRINGSDDTESLANTGFPVVGNSNKRTTTSTSSDESLPRRRGRPPKKRKVETLIINGNNPEVSGFETRT